MPGLHKVDQGRSELGDLASTVLEEYLDVGAGHAAVGEERLDEQMEIFVCPQR